LECLIVEISPSDTHMHGSRWLTGGSVGPEGSVLAFVILGLTTLAFNRVYPAKAHTVPVLALDLEMFN
jgi:hypothetical protein